MIGIVVSRADRASVSIGEELHDRAEWTETGDGALRHGDLVLREFDELHLELDGVASAFEDPEYVVVASKHSGETGPLLSAHFTGNFAEAEYGGSPRELVETTPGALKHVLRELDAAAPDRYDVSTECTHHGPTDLGAPGLYVELGSGPEQWEDPHGAGAVAEAILSLDGVEPGHDRTVVAFGGSHYAPQPTRILLETEAAVGHIAADWNLEALGDPAENRDLIAAMFEQSDADAAVFDGEWPAVQAVVESLGHRIVSETWLRETSGVDPDLVADLEAELGTVEAGLRFGDRSAEDPEILSLPEELIEACAAVDQEATVAAVAANCVAYQTAENGKRVGDRAAVPESGDDALIDALIDVLRPAYETVERRDDAVVAEREAFDPSLAADLGVPEGPLFGRLADGEAVTVEGERIEPERVHTLEITSFDV